ncbi:prolyl oligopeptidase family serine peptidase [Belliella kenyensis]|uniref:Prolyl oligopeptidase family serine peptidase n=1 Tax=Belliella kenyensis TaxID=1472724 RepID=A0ABV8EFK0_9BACT|nr:prolyl oligopeptidase family serine peptidase [Belliella kenyensis]MCH7401127.1 prolyl oligopeptidase family serine peptidase [Belliella kenyensis]MDN3604124.1 prolyl oligopeptidase family serine peptidase [Belliella kenyensis]
MSLKRYFILSLTLVCMGFVHAQQKSLQLEDYSKWSSITSPILSPNGDWFAYALRPNGGDDTLHIKSISSDDLERIPYGFSPEFSSDNKFLAYMTRPNKSETEKLKKAKKSITSTAHVKEIGSEKRFSVERAKKMAFSDNGKFWAVLKEKPENANSDVKGADLVLYNLSDKTTINIGNVAEFAFNKKSSLLAYVIDAEDKVGNGVFVLNLQNLATKPLNTDRATYQNLTWDDVSAKKTEWSLKGNQLAVLKGSKIDSLIHQPNELLVFSHLDTKPVQKSLSTNASGFPDNFVISEKGKLSFSADGKTVGFGIKAQEIKEKLSKDTVANVDVWHWKDDYIQSVQIVRANRDKNFTYNSVFHINDGKFVRLADHELKYVLDSKHPNYRIGRDDTPYLSDVNWGISPADLYRVDIRTGERKKIEDLVIRPLESSPDGRYYLYQKDTAIIAYDLQTDKKTNISEKAAVIFMDMEHPYPHENPTFGVAGWSKDGKHVILNHKYDLWMLALDGSKAENITKIGGTEKIRFRQITLDPEEEWIDTRQPLLLTAYGDKTKKEGFYELKIGGQPSPLIYEDMSYGKPTKAEKSDKVFFTKQTFVHFPDYYVADTKFSNAQRLTDANPQQKEYAWGSRKLVSFTDSRGNELQGTLTFPADYEEGKAYPTIFYFYETMSERHHQYSMPVYDDRPHFSTYASNGYLIFMPDIKFEEGKPGTSSLDAITSAAKELIKLGYADKDNIGLQGHSWGGYQTSFILTQTDMFKCIVTGAPPTNLESFYNNIYASTGTVHHGIMEIGQVRMGNGVTPWTHREIYQRENPMYHIPNIKTPFLILHGTKDGAVDWSQGLELYNAARRMGKEVIFLSYPNEGHHLTNEANQKDFQKRMKEYFDFHLMGKPAPAWMEYGVPHLEKLYEKAN